MENSYRDKNKRLPELPPEKPDVEQWTGSKLGKEYVKVVYRHPAYLTSMHSTSCKMPGWVKHNLESRLPE